MSSELKKGEELVKKGLFLEAKDIFESILEKAENPMVERIINNRLLDLDKKIKDCTHKMDIKSSLGEDSLKCKIKIVFLHDYTKMMIKKIFSSMHKKNYKTKSEISLSFSGNGASVLIKGHEIDKECCRFCRNFRQKIIDNIDKNDILINNQCIDEK